MRQAFDVFRLAATKCKKGSEKEIMYTAMAAALGFALEEPVYTDGLLEIFRETKSHLGVVFTEGQ